MTRGQKHEGMTVETKDELLVNCIVHIEPERITVSDKRGAHWLDLEGPAEVTTKPGDEYPSWKLADGTVIDRRTRCSGCSPSYRKPNPNGTTS